ncbi:hypothetical protein SUGI_0960370 [Cryptomeria japonica]|nr:hypothetical protein SUGI_0960370 [Cryptomeria japonica]
MLCSIMMTYNTDLPYRNNTQFDQNQSPESRHSDLFVAFDTQSNMVVKDVESRICPALIGFCTGMIFMTLSFSWGPSIASRI